MKVICGTCGNKFDPLKNGGICAHCGMRVSGDVIREAEENNAVQGEKLKDILKSYLNRKLAQDMKKSPLRKAPVQITLCIVLISAIAGVAIYSYNEYTNTVKANSGYESTVNMQVESCDMSEELTLSGTSVKIIGCKKADYNESVISDGFKLIEISYERGKYAGSLVLSYVYLNNGEVYVKPLDIYELEKVFDKDTDRLRELGYADSFRAQTDDEAGIGKLVFAVREDITEFTLCAYKMNEAEGGAVRAEVRYDIAVKEDKAE